MSLELALENYSKEITTRSGTTITLRPLEQADAEAYHALFQAMPSEELVYIKHRVTDMETIKAWCDNIDLGHNLPLLALCDGQIVGAGTLHQKLGGWRRHIGRVSVHCHPNHRGQGIGYTLLGELVELAQQSGLQRLEAEFMGQQTDAMKVCAYHGFEELFRLPDYVKDMQAIDHDYVLMGYLLTTDEEYAGMG